MGKTVKFISILLCFVFTIGIFLYAVDTVYKESVKDAYYDEIGDVYGTPLKNGGLTIQRSSAAREDNLLIFGSSELGSIQKPFYPVDFFSGKRDGFQVNLIGRGYSQSITHAVNFGALGQSLKGKKVVYIISPQWFSKSGLTPKEFNMNFSELQFYAFMFNKEVDKSIKISAAQRIKQLAGQDGEFYQIKIFSMLYSADNILSKPLLAVLNPYYKFKYHLLSIKDNIKTYNWYKLYNGKSKIVAQRSSTINWDEEKMKAVEAGKKEANNNEFLIENSYYNAYMKESLEAHKGSLKNDSYLESPEYTDLKLFLDICKDQGVKPLIVSVPVHGKWYDYCEFSKEDRAKYYKKINDIVASYGFDIADFSKYEYEDFFLKDVMHLGWKGWVYVDEAIDKFYHEKQ